MVIFYLIFHGNNSFSVFIFWRSRFSSISLFLSNSGSPRKVEVLLIILDLSCPCFYKSLALWIHHSSFLSFANLSFSLTNTSFLWNLVSIFPFMGHLLTVLSLRSQILGLTVGHFSFMFFVFNLKGFTV